MRQTVGIAGAISSGKVMILAIIIVVGFVAIVPFVSIPNPNPSTGILADIKTEPYIFVQNGSGSKVLIDPMENFYMVHLVQGDIYFRKYSNHRLAIPDTLLYGDGENMMIDAVFDSLGYIHCTWSTDAYGGSSVMYMKTDSDGNVITGPTQLSAANTYIDEASRIATNSLGQAYVVWSYYQGPSSSWPTAVDVLYAKIDSDGTIIFTQSYVAPSSWATGYYPHLLVDHDDNLHIVYQRGGRIPDITYANTYVYYKKFAADGTTVLVPDKRYDATHFVYWVNTVHMTLDSLNRINLVFSHSVRMPADGGAVETYYMKIDINGDVLIGPNLISDDDGLHSTMSYLATDAYDNNYVFWADEKDGNFEIYYSALNTDGLQLVPLTRLTDTPEFSSTFSMAAVFNSTNDCYWSYWQLDDGTYVIYPVDELVLEAVAGPDQEVDEGQIVWFDASNSIVPEGSSVTYEWDFISDGIYDYIETPSSAPDGSFDGRTTHTYGDNGIYTATLRITDENNASDTDTCNVTVNNVAPSISGISAYTQADITIRLAGEKWHDATMYLYENGTEIGAATVVRFPGNPDEQSATIENVYLDLTKEYSAKVVYSPDDDPVNGQPKGATPAWIIMTFEDGSEERIHHTFNVNHPETWEWDVVLNPHLLGHELTFEASASDPGSDDLTFDWSWGDGSPNNVTTYFNNAPVDTPDPYPSPWGTYPYFAADKAKHVYAIAGDYAITLTVKDDDSGVTISTITIELS